MVLSIYPMPFVHTKLGLFLLEPLYGSLVVIACDRAPLLREYGFLVRDDVRLAIDVPDHQIVFLDLVALSFDVLFHIPNYNIVWVLGMLNNDADVHGLATGPQIIDIRLRLLRVNFEVYIEEIRIIELLVKQEVFYHFLIPEE